MSVMKTAKKEEKGHDYIWQKNWDKSIPTYRDNPPVEIKSLFPTSHNESTTSISSANFDTYQMNDKL